MRRRRSLIKRGLAVIVLLLIIGAGVFAFLWLRGLLLPSWISWGDMVEAQDGGGTEVVESVVLRDKALVVYSAGSEIYRSDELVKAQSAIWSDINGDDIKEVLLLVWEKNDEGTVVSGLTLGENEAGLLEKLGYTQHIYVFDGAKEGMNQIFSSAVLSIEAMSISVQDDGVIVITEPRGRQTMWRFSDGTLVPAT